MLNTSCNTLQDLSFKVRVISSFRSKAANLLELKLLSYNLIKLKYIAPNNKKGFFLNTNIRQI